MSELLSTTEQFVNPAELVSTEATWAYLHSHKLREMDGLDRDYDHLYLAQSSHGSQGRAGQASGGGSAASGGAAAKAGRNKEPIERFATVIDTEDARFEKQRQESTKVNVQGVSATCEASLAGLSSFYQRKVESLEAILSSQNQARDAYRPQVQLKEFDEEKHMALALAPWPFQSVPGRVSAQWPDGLASFVERLDSMEPMALWCEPLDTLNYGVEFKRGALNFIHEQILRVKEQKEPQAKLVSDLGLAIRALFAFATLSASNDLLIECLALLSEVERECPEITATLFQEISEHLRKYLKHIQDQYLKKNNFTYLDTTKTSGVFTVAKFVSFAQQNEHNTSIATDGEYIYLYVSVPQKAMMYKIGSGSSSTTIAGKVYIERKADREGEVSWTYCQGKLFSRRANEEFGVITLYDAETLSTIGDAKLLCNDIFSSSNCQQANRHYPLLSDGTNLYIVTMKIVQKRRTVKADMRQQYQQMLEDKKKSSEKAAELEKEKEAKLEKEKERKNAQKSEKEIQLEKKREIERKLIEMQAREEELLRSRVAAQRGGRGGRGRRGGREYGRGGARVPADSRRGIPSEDPHELKLNGGAKDSSPTDPSAYKVCQFYLHEFKTTEPKPQEQQILFQGEEIGVITEIEQAFCGYFESNECDMAYKDHNLDACEAAYQLACDAEENRYKLTLPLSKSVLLCESLITQESAAAKKGSDGDVQVAEDSILAPSSLQSGKWVINGGNVTFHQNIMQEGTMIHVFSTDDSDERPMTQLTRARSTPAPAAQPLGIQALESGKSAFPTTTQLLSVPKELYQQELEGLPENLDPTGLFDFRQPDLQRDRDLLKEMILSGEGFEEFGDAPMDFFAKEFKALHVDKKLDEGAGAAGREERTSDELDERDMFEDLRLLGTYRASFKNQDGLNPNYRGAMTYDRSTRKYYVLILAYQQRYIAVVNDLHRFAEEMQRIQSDGEISSKAERVRSIIDLIPSSFGSSVSQFQEVTLKLLQVVEGERFNLPWRWNHWSNLFSHAISYKRLRDATMMDQSSQHLLPLSQQLKKNESQVDLQTKELKAASTGQSTQQKNKIIQKLQTRLQKVQEGELEVLRAEYGFEFNEEEGKKLRQLLEKKGHAQKKAGAPTEEEPKVPAEKEKSELEQLVQMSRREVEESKRIVQSSSKLFSEGGRFSKAHLFSEQPGSAPLASREAQGQGAGGRCLLPEESIIVHREFKKVHTFCQTGSVHTLRHLHSLLKGAKDQALRERVRDQMLIWSTFADELSAEHADGRAALNEVHNHLVEAIAELPRGSGEWETCWRTLIVGWDQLCRSTEQQVAVMQLALSQEDLSRESVSDESEGDSEKKNGSGYESLYAELLGKVGASKRSTSPLGLLFARFFRSHSSFYELETLNKSSVRSHLVLLDAQVFQRAIQEMQDSDKKASANDGPKNESEDAAQTREARVATSRADLPPSCGILGQPSLKLFSQFPRAPISLKAVQSWLKPPLAGAQQSQTRHGDRKKQRGGKGAQRQPEKEPVARPGFVLEELTLKQLVDGVKVHRNARLSAKFFCMPLGSALTGDAFALESLSASATDKRPERFDPWRIMRMYSAEEAQFEDKEQLVQEIERLRASHLKASGELVDRFLLKIEQSFALDKDGSTAQRTLSTVTHTFVGLAKLACSRIRGNMANSPLGIVSKVLKLSQNLLRQELGYLEHNKIEALRITEMIPLFDFIMQTISTSILDDPSSLPLVGYNLLPGLVEAVALLKEAFKVREGQKDAPESPQVPALKPLNLLDCLQALTSEGIDFTRERVFETPHPYPQNDYSQSETIEVQKAIGFIVELDKRCSAEHSTDQLVMYSGSDHIFQINPNFATQIKLSTKPNTRQPYLLLGSRMKIDFRAFGHRQRRGHYGGAAYLQQATAEASQRRTGQNNAQNEARWGFRVVVRPVYSEPQNIVLSGQVRSAQRKQIYTQLGGEQSCHRVEILLNSLVCLSSQLAQEMARIENFWPIRDKDQADEEVHDLHARNLLSSVKSSSIQKLSKQQLFRGGLFNPRSLILGSQGEQSRETASEQNYHELIKHELQMRQDFSQKSIKRLVEQAQEWFIKADGREEARPEDKAEQMNESQKRFVPCCDQWSPKVKELVGLEVTSDEKEPGKSHRIVFSAALERAYAKIRELVPFPVVIRQLFMKPSARKQQHEWIDLERLLIVALLHHSQSVHLVAKFVEVRVPNLKSSGGVFQYGAGLKGSYLSEENQFLMDQLKLIGNQLNDLLMWLLLRVQGEMDAQEIIQSIFETTQRMIDQKVVQLEAEAAEQRKRELEEKAEAEKKRLQELEEQKKVEPANPSQGEGSDAVKKLKAAASVAVVVTGNKNRRIKRGKIVRSVIDTSQAKQIAKKDQQKKQNKSQSKPEEEKKEETREELKEEPAQQLQVSKYLDWSLSQINSLKNEIEQEAYAAFSSRYLGPGADAVQLKPLCLLFNVQYNSEDPTETVRQLFKKIKARIRRVIDLDDTEDTKLAKKIDDEDSRLDQFMQSPYVEVCRDAKSRLLMLLETRPSVGYLHNVTKIDTSKCFSRYGSVKFSQRGGFFGPNYTSPEADALSGSARSGPQRRLSAKEQDMKQANAQKVEENSQLDDEHDDELADIMNMDVEDDGEKLAPLGLERSKSQQIGLRHSLKAKPKTSGKISGGNNAAASAVRADQDSQADWLEIHRRWKQWNRFHKQLGSSTEDKDLTSPFCSPLHSVLQFAKNSEIQDPAPLRSLLCEQQKRAAFRLFALKYQGKLYDIVQGTPYQRFIWGNQSHSLVSSSLDGVEACGEALVAMINERSKKLVKQLMSYTVVQADNMKHYQEILEKYLKQQDSKSASGSQGSKSKQGGDPGSSKKNSLQGKDSKNKSFSSQSTSDSSHSQVPPESLDRRLQKITFDDFIPWQMSTVMHSLNDLRVLLSDPFTQAYVLQALKEDQFRLIDHKLEKQMKLTEKQEEEKKPEGNQQSSQVVEHDLGLSNIRQFLKALIQIMVQSHSSSPLAEQFPNSSKLCQSAFKVAKIVLSQFVSDRQQIREAETSRILLEMMLEILVSHLEKVCGLPDGEIKPGSNLAKSIEDTNLDEIVLLLKLLQEIMRISSDTQRALNQHQMLARHVADKMETQSSKVQSHLAQQQLLSEGSEQAMRCAKLLAYLMVEYEVPVVVRSAIRCARIFFFGLVDFERLELYQASLPETRAKGSSLGTCCENKFLIETLKKIGERISHQQLDKQDLKPQEPEPEGSSLIQGEQPQPEVEAKQEAEKPEGTLDVDGTLDRKYVVYANINSQIEDFTFLVTALYHWEKLYPAIGPTQPTDPKPFRQKSAKKPPAKKEEKKAEKKPAQDGQEGGLAGSDGAKPVDEKKDGDKEEVKQSEEDKALEAVADLFGEADKAGEEEKKESAKEPEAKEPEAKQPEPKVEEAKRDQSAEEAKQSEEAKPVEAQEEPKQAEEKKEEAKSENLEPQVAGPEPAQDAGVAEEAKVDEVPDALNADINLQENFELFKRKREGKERCQSLLQEIQDLESNKDLIELLRQQQKLSLQALISEITKRDGPQAAVLKDARALIQALAEKGGKEVKDDEEMLKLVDASGVQASTDKRAMRPSSESSKQGISAMLKGTIVGSGNQVSEINLVPNRILVQSSPSPQSAAHAGSQKLSINTLQTAFVDIMKHSNEIIYEDDPEDEQLRKLSSKNFYERIAHHLFQALSIASQLQLRYSVPVTEPLSHKEASEFAKLLQQAYKGQIEPVPINPYLKEEFLHKRIAETKKLSQYFPFTLQNVMAGIKAPELPPGHAPPVVICQRTLVVTVMTEKFSKDIEKLIESRVGNLKALEKNPLDGFRLNVCKNKTKRQGPSVSNCILALIQFLREMLIGFEGKKGTSQIPDTASQRSSAAGFSESNQTSERHQGAGGGDNKQAYRLQRQQELRQSEMMEVLNQALQVLKTQSWASLQASDKQIILGLFAVIGGWYGFNRVGAGSRVRVQINGCWSQATVVDEGVGKRRAAVILDEDPALSLVKVPHSKVEPQQTSIDQGINEKLNFDDLCEAITFLHKQQAERLAEGNDPSKPAGEVQLSIAAAMSSEEVLFQMLLKVCSKLNWNKIDQQSPSFSQFRQILIQVTSQASRTDGQSHEDKSKEYLEKQLIESWERVIDRNETKNLDFYSPREFATPSDEEFLLGTLKQQTPRIKKEPEQLVEDLLVAPYIDADYVQPTSSYLQGLPEPITKKNQKEAALKLLFYWEKNVLPTTREFVRATFQKWEMQYYFEQIRHHLRQGDQRAAIADALVLWENKVPNGVILPNESTDWNAKVADECIVDTWALAKISLTRSPSASGSSNSQGKQPSQSQYPDASLPLIIRLQNLGVQAIVVQIKLVDSRYNIVLGEYYEPENFCSHFIWLPISHLYELDYPLPPRSVGYSRRSLTLDYLQSISNINSLYARQTLIKFFSSCRQSTSKALGSSEESRDRTSVSLNQFGELKLQELISWSVQEEFSNNPFAGWTQDLSCAIPIKQASQVSDLSSVTTGITERPEQTNIQKLIEATSDRMIVDKLLQRERRHRTDSQSKDTSASSSDSSPRGAGNPLGLIRELLSEAVKAGDSESHKTLSDLADWTFTNWIQMSEQVSSNRAVFDLCKQKDNRREGGGSEHSSSDSQLIALHSVIQSSRGVSDAQSPQSIATLLMFHRVGCSLTPCSKVQFYSDPNEVNLVSEITAGTEAKTALPPLLLNHGQIWAKMSPGSLSLLRREQQLDAQSSLPCAVFQIPKQWSVVCWLTDVLSSSFLENSGENSTSLAKEIYQKLITAIVQFYQDSCAPQLIKSQVLGLLTRLIRKLRFILKQDLERHPPSDALSPQLTQDAHLSQIFITQDFIKTILSDIDTSKREETKASNSSGEVENQTLYSSFIQDSIELLMTIVVPINKNALLNSYKDILSVGQGYLEELQEWLDPLMKTSMFMHFFNNEIRCLPVDLLQEIHDQTKLENHRALDHILVIDRVPVDERFPKSWLLKQILGLCKKHSARILNPQADICFLDGEYTKDTEGGSKQKCYRIVVLLDGWDHMTPLPDLDEFYTSQLGTRFKGLGGMTSQDYRKLVPLLDSDSEDPDEEGRKAAEEKRKQEEQKQKELEEQLKPTEWSCDICTLINPMSVGSCQVCGQGRRPSMEQLMAELKKQKLEEVKDAGAQEEAEGGDPSIVEHENLLRLKFLSLDLSRFVKAEQKRMAKEQAAQELEKVRLQKEQEANEKDEQKAEEAKPAEEPKPDGGAIPAKGDEQLEEEKKHQESDAEKSDEEDEEQWQDEDSGSLDEAKAEEAKAIAEELEADANADPRLKKLAELGYDISILEADPQLAEALLASASLQEEEAKEAERKKREDEEAERKQKKEAEEKAKQQREMEQLKKAGLEPTKVEWYTLEVLQGIDKISENSDAVRALFGFLTTRLVDPTSGELGDRCKRVLSQVHRSLSNQEPGQICWPKPEYDEQLADYGLSVESIREMELEEFEQTCSVLIAADVVLFFRLLESQGYDYWLQRRANCSFMPPTKAEKFDKLLIEKLKEFVEINFCEEKKVIQSLEPYHLRLLSKTQDAAQVLPQKATAPRVLEEEKQIVSDSKQEDGQVANELVTSEGDQPLGYYDGALGGLNGQREGPHHWFSKVSQLEVGYNWALIKTFSKYFAVAVPFINCSISADTPEEGAISITLSAYMSSLRNLCLSNTKYELKHLILKRTSVEREKAPVLQFERLKMLGDNQQGKDGSKPEGAAARAPAGQPKTEANQSGSNGSVASKADQQQRNFMFTQAYEQMKDIDAGSLRPSQPRGADPHLSFEIYFKGEHVVGMGGPYRQFFSDVAQELQMVAAKTGLDGDDGREAAQADDDGTADDNGPDSNAQDSALQYLGLLVPSRNKLRGSPVGKDKFVLSPQRVSQHDLSLYNFLGVLMGVCVRTSTTLSLNLPAIVWKQLVGQRLSLEDIEELDDGIIAELKEMLTCQSPEAFEDRFGERTFTTSLSDESKIELEEGGSQRALTFENRQEYASKALLARMRECSQQCDAIKRGMCQIIPEALLNMVSYRDLEEWVYGKKQVDIQLLRRHTEYAKGYNSGSKEIQWFWEILEELSQVDRRKFIRFCWAEETIPPNDEEFERRQMRMQVKCYDQGQHIDKRLPKADTCFFNFELPKYSSKDIMKRLILFAISFDNVSLNAEEEEMRFDDNVSQRSRESY